jgi:NADH dehydrogenase [ubiquinone] 1 alpha subcomplex assembly factor 2
VRAKTPEGLKDADKPVEAAAAEEEEDEPAMQTPDHKKHFFNERPDGTRVKEKKYKDDPWKQARGAPSETWQPDGWSPSVASKR